MHNVAALGLGLVELHSNSLRALPGLADENGEYKEMMTYAIAMIIIITDAAGL